MTTAKTPSRQDKPVRPQKTKPVPPNGEASAESDGVQMAAPDSSAEELAKLTAGDLPSSEPGDLENLTRFVATEDVGLKQSVAVICLVGPPNKMAVIRTSKDMSLYRNIHVLEVDDATGKKAQYLVDPKLNAYPEFADRVKVKKTAPWVTTDTVPGLWLLSVDAGDNTWVKSAINIIFQAQDRWVSVIPQRAGGQYRMLPAEGDHGEPEFPQWTFLQWLAMAFPRDRRIMDREHPVAKKLRA